MFDPIHDHSLIDLSMGRSRSGMCQLRNRPNHVGSPTSRPTADHKMSRFKWLGYRVRICQEMIGNPHTWENRWVFPIYRWSDWLESDFKEQTHQPTRRSQFLEVEAHCRSSPASGQSVLGTDRTVCLRLVGYGFRWTALLVNNMYAA